MAQNDENPRDDEQEPNVLPEHLTEVRPLAEAVLVLSERLDVLYEEDDAKHETEDESDSESGGPPEAIVALLRELSQAALTLAAALDEDDEALFDLDEWSQERELLPVLVELPMALVAVSELDAALAVARAFSFVAPESYSGDIAIIFAESGDQAAARAQLDANLEQYADSFLTALKAGEALEALGDAAEAEASYRRALTLATDEAEREIAAMQLAGFLEDAGREGEIEALLASTDASEAKH
ncbi:MAG: hypothetical protein EOO73_14555 [Myxococcales bacterium]|nr:MAG: hypothetical protein EOO73_14555 [Myxococcales bacterium]